MLTTVPAGPLQLEPPDCAMLDFTCQTTNAVGGWIAGGARGMMGWATGGLEYAVGGSNVTEGQLANLAEFARSLFGGIGVWIVLLCLLIALTSTAVRLRGMGILMALGRSVLAVFLFSAVVWLLTDPYWSVIKLGDEIASGLVQGLGLDKDTLNARFQAMFGLTDDSLSWNTDPNVAFGSAQDQATADSAAISDLSVRLGQWALLAVIFCVVWLLTMILQVMLALRLMTLLVLGASIGLAVAFLPLGKGGPAVLKKFSLAWFALWAAKPIVAIVLGIGVRMLDTTAAGFNLPQMISAIVVIMMASIAPLASMRFFGWLDAGASQMADGGERVAAEQGGQTVKVVGGLASTVGGGAMKAGGAVVSKGVGAAKSAMSKGISKLRDTEPGSGTSNGTGAGTPPGGGGGGAGGSASQKSGSGEGAGGTAGAKSTGATPGGRHSGAAAGPKPAVSPTGTVAKRPPAAGGVKPPAGGGMKPPAGGPSIGGGK